MHCPYCSFENIEGVDQCARCDFDLTDIRGFQESEHSDIERNLLKQSLEVVATKDYVEISPDTTVRDAIDLMNKGGFHSAMIIENKSIVGIFTERDILYKLAKQFRDKADSPVSDFMTTNPVTLRSQDPIVFGLNRMMVGEYRHIPIEKDGQLSGMVSVRDVLRYMVEQIN